MEPNSKTFMEEVRDGIHDTNAILGNHVLSTLTENNSILKEIRDLLRSIQTDGIVVRSKSIDID